MSHTDVVAKLKDALDALQESKPKDKTAVDRAYSICINEMEKILVYFESSAIPAGFGSGMAFPDLRDRLGENLGLARIGEDLRAAK